MDGRRFGSGRLSLLESGYRTRLIVFLPKPASFTGRTPASFQGLNKERYIGVGGVVEEGGRAATVDAVGDV